MTVTPLDLPTQQFKSSVRGYDRREVSGFVSELAADSEEALRSLGAFLDQRGMRDCAPGSRLHARPPTWFSAQS